MCNDHPPFILSFRVLTADNHIEPCAPSSCCSSPPWRSSSPGRPSRRPRRSRPGYDSQWLRRIMTKSATDYILQDVCFYVIYFQTLVHCEFLPPILVLLRHVREGLADVHHALPHGGVHDQAQIRRVSSKKEQKIFSSVAVLSRLMRCA